MSEHQLCKALMDWVRIMEKHRYPCLKKFRHIPNEGKRNKLWAYQEGIRKGILDYQMLKSASDGDRLYHGFCMEVKDTGNKPTEAQYAEIEVLTHDGYYACWTDNLDKAIEYVEKYCRWVHH
jgi:hypothetical protein